MVKLSYCFKLKATFEDVWKYFSHFQNIAEYDPCVKRALVIKEGNSMIGRKYDITTLHHGKEGRMIYEVKKYSENYEGPFRNNMVEVYGSNQKLQSTDIITVKQISNDSNGFNLILEYKADLSLRGVYWFGTVFALGTFKEIAENAEHKCKKKCFEKWGDQNVQTVPKL